MRRSTSFLLLLFPLTVVLATEKNPLTLSDILAWKRVQSPIVSNDGRWFAYKLAPNDGDSEVVLRDLLNGNETRFPIGEMPRPDPNLPPGPPATGFGARDLAFSDDSRWLALQPYPTVKEGKALKKARKPIQAKATLVELATGRKTEFEGIRRFAFSGERSTILAMSRYPAAPAGGPAAVAATPPTPGAKPDEKPQGTDLLIHELSTASDLNIGNVSDFAFDKNGNFLAWLSDAQDKEGNGINVRDLTSGAIYPLDSAKATYKGLTWSEKGDALATLRGVEDKAWEEKLYTLVGFRNFRPGAMPEKIVFDPAGDSAVAKGMTINPARNPVWMADLSALTFTVHEVKPKDPKKKPEDIAEDRPDMVIWHYKDSRLQPMQQVQEPMDKSFGYSAAYLPSSKKFVQLADSTLKNVHINPDARFAVGMDVREYELTGNLDGRHFQDVYVVDPQTGERKLALRKARWFEGASPKGTHFLYYDDGVFYIYNMATGETRSVTKGLGANFVDIEDDHNVVKPPTRSMGFSSDGGSVLLSDGWDIWKVPVASSDPAVNLTMNGKKDKIRYRNIFRLDPDAKGVDLSKPLYIAAQSELTKEGGIGMIAPGQAGVKMLQWDKAAFTVLLKARNADTYLYTRETAVNPPDFYTTGPALANGTKLPTAIHNKKISIGHPEFA